jgi:2-haloacid dehalogenase
MLTTIQAVIFDFGNVLIEWDPRRVYRRYFQNEEQAMERFLQEVSFMEWNAQQDKGRSFQEGVAVLSEQFPHYSDLIQAYYDNWKESIGDALPNTVDILERLKKAGYAVYGLSNWSAETFPHVRHRHDFFNLLDDMVISGEVGSIKPEPLIFEILLEKIGRPAYECLFIDDSLANIQQAKKMGFATIHFLSPGQLEKELKNFGLL